MGKMDFLKFVGGCIFLSGCTLIGTGVGLLIFDILKKSIQAYDVIAIWFYISTLINIAIMYDTWKSVKLQSWFGKYEDYLWLIVFGYIACFVLEIILGAYIFAADQLSHTHIWSWFIAQYTLYCLFGLIYLFIVGLVSCFDSCK